VLGSNMANLAALIFGLFSACVVSALVVAAIIKSRALKTEKQTPHAPTQSGREASERELRAPRVIQWPRRQRPPTGRPSSALTRDLRRAPSRLPS
jgi:hypothetical protein